MQDKSPSSRLRCYEKGADIVEALCGLCAVKNAVMSGAEKGRRLKSMRMNGSNKKKRHFLIKNLFAIYFIYSSVPPLFSGQRIVTFVQMQPWRELIAEKYEIEEPMLLEIKASLGLLASGVHNLYQCCRLTPHDFLDFLYGDEQA